MRPFFFGTSQKPLFGLYHSPNGNSSRQSGIVLCYPFGPEYLRAHRALRALASRLAVVGFHALRFDYYACGDSAGASEEGDTEQWMADICLAIAEIREMSGVQQVSLLGIRLGASMAALVGSWRSDIDKLVLWDPVVKGKRYLLELIERHRALLESRPKPRDLPEHDPPLELLGVPLTPKLRESLEAIDLLTLQRSPAKSVLVVSSDAGPDALSLRDHLGRIGAPPDYQHIPGSRVWIKEHDLEQAIVPHATVNFVTSWLCGSAS